MSSDSGNSIASPERARINGLPERDWLQEAYAKFGASLEGAKGMNLLQVLHEGARIFEMAMERNESVFRGSWFIDKWTGFNNKAWAKLLSYQVSVFALLQAAMEIATRGEGRDRDVHVFVQRSLAHQCDPLEESIKKLLASRDLSAEWEQLPFFITSLVSVLEKDTQFAAVTSTDNAACPSRESDVALLKLTISTCAAVMKLGPATVACPAFSTTLLEEIGRLMSMLVDLIPISEVYTFACNLGLRREFLSHFGSRAANNTCAKELSPEERLFWVDLCEQHLRNGLVREGVLSKLRPDDTVEALENDLAVFGFFAALGRNARAYLSGDRDAQLSESVSSLLRYLEGGAVLFYPQLSRLTYYQLFVEVMCEEIQWLPTFPKTATSTEDAEILTGGPVSLYTVLNVCSRWISDFLKYSSWVQTASGLRVVDFLLKCQSRLIECRQTLSLNPDVSWMECRAEAGVNLEPPSISSATLEQLRLLDEDLQNMEEALCKLESLLEGANKSERLAVARQDLQKIRQLKEEAKALEASFKATADGKGRSELTTLNPENEKAYTDVFNKSIEKLKEAGSDLWRGTQLLGTDVAAATILLRNNAMGRKLTEREKKMLRRTFTDLASVIPIGVLMLLPVTAVGHAAMLAAIQKYVPALIPSAYARERLDLLRQLEKVKQMASRSDPEEQKASDE